MKSIATVIVMMTSSTVTSRPWPKLSFTCLSALALHAATLAVFIVSSAASGPPLPTNALLNRTTLAMNNDSMGAPGSFDFNYYVAWGNSLVKFLDNRSTVQLVMDRSSGMFVIAGSGFASKYNYLFGYFSLQMKLIPGDSSGVVTAFYVTSRPSPNHDEMDMEFLGNRPGQPHYLSTNVFVNGVGDRESRFKLWFDATADFHTYSILWNPNIIMFMVDQTLIRVFKNAEKTLSIPYPTSRSMQVMASIWNGESWATDGGKIKINWTSAPFIASFRGFAIEGKRSCNREKRALSVCQPSPPTSEWWERLGKGGRLSPKESTQLRWARKYRMTYDYCTDAKRYPKPPLECTVNTG
eukprot:Gb_34156 [translate_table: standard]